MENKKTVFERLSAINVNEKVEKKKDLTYLSWPWAWAEVKRECPDARYIIKETEFDEVLGFMCHTEVTIEGETLEMWLPVMDGANKSMLKIPYTYKTKYGDKSVEAATTFDINKTIMRCLVKNLAMFGLGLYIYAGEDLPDTKDSDAVGTQVEAKVIKTESKPLQYYKSIIDSLDSIEGCMSFYNNYLADIQSNPNILPLLSTKKLSFTINK
jgi:hypothetical protein